MSKSKNLRIVFQALVLALVFFAVQFWQTRKLIASRTQLPETHSLSYLGKQGPLVLSELVKGKRAVLYFFAPWCSVCKVSAGNLATIKKWFGDKVAIVVIALDFASEQDVRDFLSATELDKDDSIYLLKGGDDVSNAFRVNAFPTYYVLDDQSLVASSSIGYSPTVGLAARIWISSFL